MKEKMMADAIESLQQDAVIADTGSLWVDDSSNEKCSAHHFKSFEEQNGCYDYY